MKYWRAVVPAQHYFPAAWPGWTEVNREKLEHTAGVPAYGSNRSMRSLSSGVGHEVVHLVKPRTS